jgi:hypothetical protein
VVAVFIILSFFGLMAHRFYLRNRAPAPQNEKPDNLGSGLDWRATPEARRAYLADLRAKQAKQAQSYAWVDQKKGIVQLPIDRAMDLVVKEEASR